MDLKLWALPSSLFNLVPLMQKELGPSINRIRKFVENLKNLSDG